MAVGRQHLIYRIGREIRAPGLLTESVGLDKALSKKRSLFTPEKKEVLLD